jgi:hypothetical protein
LDVTTMVEQFSHIGIRSENPSEVGAWFENNLEAEILDSGEFGFDDWDRSVEFVGLDVGDKNAFVVNPTPYEAAGVLDSVDEGIAHFGVVVDDADAAIAEYVDRGGRKLLDPFRLDETRYGFCAAPGGFRVEFVEPL